MKILLINPHDLKEKYYYPFPQIALGHLSAALKSNGFSEVKIIDFQLLGADFAKVEEIFKKEKPEIIAIRFWSCYINTVKEYIKIARQLFGNKVRIIVGGPYPSVVPERAMKKFPEIDFAFAGEAEVGLPLLLQRINEDREINYEDILGLVWRTKEDEIKINSLSREKELEHFPIDWDNLNLEAYHKLRKRSPNFDWGKNKRGFIFTSRGCPYRCTYCSASIINGAVVRYFSPTFVINDIKKLYYEHGARHFNILDDNFTFNKSYVIEFCQEYLKNPLPGVTFSCPNGIRADRIDEEMLVLMKKCGFVKLMIGIESGSPSILKLMKKNLDLDKVKICVELMKKYKIQSWGFFILGYPGETVETLKQTINFALELPLDWASFSIFSPIPGTEVYQQLILKGKIDEEKYEMEDYHSAKSYCESLSIKDLRRAQKLAYFKFYLRFKQLLNLLKETSSDVFTDVVKKVFR
ncbi:MAG: radical SAM protein [bacterium]